MCKIDYKAFRGQASYVTYLSSTDVAGSLVPPDVLLPGLKSKTVHFFPSGISGPKIKHPISTGRHSTKNCHKWTCFFPSQLEVNLANLCGYKAIKRQLPNHPLLTRTINF